MDRRQRKIEGGQLKKMGDPPLNIRPTIGVGPVEFGMSPADVAQFETVIGPRFPPKNMNDGTVVEVRRHTVALIEYTDGAVSAIELDNPFDIVHFNGEPLAGRSSLDILQMFERANRAALYGLNGSVLFNQLSISCSDFFWRDTGRDWYWEDREDFDQQRGIALAPAGAYDPHLRLYEPISFLS